MNKLKAKVIGRLYEDDYQLKISGEPSHVLMLISAAIVEYCIKYNFDDTRITMDISKMVKCMFEEECINKNQNET